MKRRRFVRMKLVSIPSSPSTRRMVRTPSYYIHLPHHRSQISRTTVLLPTAPPSPPTQVSEYNQNQSTSIHPPTQTSPHVTQHTHPTSPPLTYKPTSSGHLHHRPIPPKPNISIRLPTFQQSHHPPGIRPCRKHPPHSLIPRHYRNVVRRISNKGRLHLS